MSAIKGPLKGPRRSVPITVEILNGRPWCARLVRHPYLRKHARRLGRAVLGDSPFIERLRDHARRVFGFVETRSRILTECHPRQFDAVSALLRVSAYQGDWLRPPEEWRPDPAASALRQWNDLLRHLFCRWPVPDRFDSAWLTRGPLEHLERDLFCALGAGRSPRSVPGFPGTISTRLLHEALGEAAGAGESESWREKGGLGRILWRARLRLLRTTPELVQAVLASRVPGELGRHGEWRRLVEKFATLPGPAPAPTDFGIVVDALHLSLIREGPDRMRALFALPTRELIRHCRSLWRALMAAAGGGDHALLESAPYRAELATMAAARWRPFLDGREWIGPPDEEDGRRQWTIVELCSGLELSNEGRSQRHCVATYRTRCHEGNSAIFSLRCRHPNYTPHTSRQATVEVKRTSRSIVQVRGYRNRTDLSPAVWRNLEAWAKAHELRW